MTTRSSPGSSSTRPSARRKGPGWWMSPPTCDRRRIPRTPCAGSSNVGRMSTPAGEAVIFPTCLVEQLRPELAGACAALLAAADGGAPRTAHGGACCGQPAWNAGFTGAARRVAGATLRALRRTSGPVVVPSGSCATMMQRHWPEVFAGTSHEAEARSVAGRVVELATYLDARSPHEAV